MPHIGPVGSGGGCLPASENSSPPCYTPRGWFIVLAAVMVLVCLCTSNTCAPRCSALVHVAVAGGSKAVLDRVCFNPFEHVVIQTDILTKMCIYTVYIYIYIYTQRESAKTMKDKAKDIYCK